MGTLYDYYRASSDAAAVELIESLDGGPVVIWGQEPPVDAIGMQNLDPWVTLAKLIGIARGVGWEPDLLQTVQIWGGEEDGPWLESIDDDVRDTLAAIREDQMHELAGRWGEIEELARFRGPIPAEVMVIGLEKVVGLAKRARTAGDHLYVWICP